MESSWLMILSTLSLKAAYPRDRLFEPEPPIVSRYTLFAPDADAWVFMKPSLFRKGLTYALNKGPSVGMQMAMMPRYISSEAMIPTWHKVAVQSADSLVCCVTTSRHNTRAMVLQKRLVGYSHVKRADTGHSHKPKTKHSRDGQLVPNGHLQTP